MKKVSDLRIPYTWAERRPVVLDRFFYVPGHFDRHAEWEMIPWSDPRLFGAEAPVAIEYCSGNGQWICERAKQHPNIHWVAVEKRFDRARKIWARLHREQIPNLFVVCSEAIIYTRHYVPLQSVSKIFVNFPDPWPKLRHAKHRLIRPEFLQEVERIAAPSADAILTTDDPPCAAQMLSVIGERPAWKPLFPAPHYLTEWPDYGASFFFDLWKQKGRTIHYLQFAVNT